LEDARATPKIVCEPVSLHSKRNAAVKIGEPVLDIDFSGRKIADTGNCVSFTSFFLEAGKCLPLAMKGKTLTAGFEPTIPGGPVSLKRVLG
jgi:hypothetical protein